MLIICDTPGCGREVPKGGEGLPEICPTCLACLKKYATTPAIPIMYSIGAVCWNGISKLVEEAGEIIQVCGKLLGTNGEVEHWEGSNLRERLEEELGDLSAAIVFVMNHCEIDATRIVLRMGAKLEAYEQWHTENEAKRLSGAQR